MTSRDEVRALPALETLVNRSRVISPHDLMTPVDALHFRILNPEPYLDNIREWPILGRLVEELGEVIDANSIASELVQDIPPDG